MRTTNLRKIAVLTTLGFIISLIFGSSAVLDVSAAGLPSTNYVFAGYFIQGASGSVTFVIGSWVVPTVKSSSCNPSLPQGAYFVGIDNGGLAGSGSVRDGVMTSSYCSSPTTSSYFAMLLSGGSGISPQCTVLPGDHMTAIVSYNPSTQVITERLHDGTHRLNCGASGFLSTLTYSATDPGATRTTASFSLSRCCTNAELADFVRLQTSDDKVTLGGVTKVLGAWAGTSGVTLFKVNMVSTNPTRYNLATTSVVSSSSSSFTLTWKAFS